MVELVKYLVSCLAENKEDIDVTLDGNVIKVTLAKSDMGKVIGRQGKIIKAIRTILRSCCTKDERFTVEVVEKPE